MEEITLEEYETALKSKKEIHNRLFNLKMELEMSKKDINQIEKIQKEIKECKREYANVLRIIKSYERGIEDEKYKRR